MRRPRRGTETTGSRHLSLSATDAEWDVVRRNAQARGLSIARYLLGLVERGGADEGATVSLTRDEQRELLRSVREVRALMLGRAVPEEAEPGEAVPAHPPPPVAVPERTGPEGDGGDAEAERLRREIRDWPGRAEALVADRPARDAPPAVLTERRRRMEALLAEASAMRAEGSPHAPHLAAMPADREALRKAEAGLVGSRIVNETLEAVRLDEEALAVARGTGGIAHDAPGYAVLMERLRALEAMRHLPEGRREWARGLIARDARWRRDRKRVADFLGRARAAARARGDLEEEIRALHEMAGSAPPDRGPPEQVPRNKSGAGSGRQGQAADGDWRAQAAGLVQEGEKIAEGIPRRELTAHLKAADAAPDALDKLTARLRAMLGRG
ncbi:MAG: hypothetical protein OYH76_21205 [Defluviicoccus sp.]|nr:hypothetical protein [Defluviicoccus sp.]MDE0278422.1 hypothetical protein [Defluviicoccus sp.]